MAYYITYGEFQRHLKEYYQRTGSRMQFPEMTDYLYRKGLLLASPPQELAANKMYGPMPDEEFDKIMDSFVLTLTPNVSVTSSVNETDIIPHARDVFVIRHPRYTRPAPHIHNYFEIDFVASGQCTFVFENEKRTMKAGELCIIAPHSRHDLTIDDESTVFCIMIRKSTFNTTFFSLMSQKNLLSYFFRTILQGDSHSNYLLFYSEDIVWLKNLMRNAMSECYKRDSFSNDNCISWIHLFFSHLIRDYSKTIQFYNYQMGTDFSLILQYIQHNYQTLTLASLAEFFHYSEPHLSTLIKRNTGCSFTALVKQLRMADAVSYLTNTKMTVSAIAECIGYNSADHFSRVFRSTYKISPQEYRRKHQTPDELFTPFEEISHSAALPVDER
ncbi:MAG: AraC family transcriptional regulator [Eubacteriales bacterium]|nr:AraC family transcriptional regulator [Eubacteriales bacterium]